MSKVQGNPEEIRTFSRSLSIYSEQLNQGLKDIKNKNNHLSQTWRDQENREFSEYLNTSLGPLNKLIEDMERYSKFLKEKAQILDEYLNKKIK